MFMFPWQPHTRQEVGVAKVMLVIVCALFAKNNGWSINCKAFCFIVKTVAVETEKSLDSEVFWGEIQHIVIVVMLEQQTSLRFPPRVPELAEVGGGGRGVGSFRSTLKKLLHKHTYKLKFKNNENKKLQISYPNALKKSHFSRQVGCLHVPCHVLTDVFLTMLGFPQSNW